MCNFEIIYNKQSTILIKLSKGMIYYASIKLIHIWITFKFMDYKILNI